MQVVGGLNSPLLITRENPAEIQLLPHRVDKASSRSAQLKATD
jgi:hypothetical protein